MDVLGETQLSLLPMQKVPEWVDGKSLSHGAGMHSGMPSVSGSSLHCGKCPRLVVAAASTVGGLSVAATDTILGEAIAAPPMHCP
jgi:hypothetical protein